MKRIVAIIAVSLSFILLSAGCVDRQQIKTDVQQALALHTEMNNYRFSGSAKLDMDAPDAGWSSNPLTNALLTMVMKGEIHWQGVASIDPLRLEATLRLGANDSSASFEVPLLIKDNMMYIHIPALNKDNQYFEINLQSLGELADQPQSDKPQQQLQASGELFAAILSDIVAQIDPKRFAEVNTNDPASRILLTATLNDKQKKEALTLWFKSMPSVVDRLIQAGFLSQDKANLLLQQASADHQKQIEQQMNNIIFNKPMTTSVEIGTGGFVRFMQLSADITLKQAQGGDKHWKADIANQYDDINMNPPFIMPIPEDVKPFTDVLNIMSETKQ